jgi:hypothetical protein
MRNGTIANMAGSNRSIEDGNHDKEHEVPNNARIDRHEEETQRRHLTKEQGQEHCQQHQDQDLTHRRGGGSVVDDHRSPFSGGGHPQDSTSPSQGHDNGSSRSHRVLEDVIDKGGQDLVVTVSDEAFILIYKNFIDKWIAKFRMEQQGEKAVGMIKGKYTSSVNDECLCGGALIV